MIIAGKRTAKEKLELFKKMMDWECNAPPLHYHIARKFFDNLKSNARVLFHCHDTYQNQFYGYRFIFPNKTEARKAAKVMGKKWEDSGIHRHYDGWSICYFQ